MDIEKTLTNAKLLADACKQLHELLEKKSERIKLAYRIELTKNENNKWSLRACLDPIVWFDELSQIKSTKFAVKAAIKFINDCKQIQNDNITIPSIIQFKREICKFKICNKKGKKEDPCMFLHIDWECEEVIDHKVQGKQKCSFKQYEENKLRINTKPEYWSLYSRLEPTREVLLIPNNTAIKNNIIPHGNGKLVLQSEFWKSVQEYSYYLYQMQINNNRSKLSNDLAPVERIVINFGNWETGMRVNPFLCECHAHVHLWLTKQFVCSDTFTQLNGHDYPPEDYLLINALKLENERLTAVRFTDIENTLQTLLDLVKKMSQQIN